MYDEAIKAFDELAASETDSTKLRAIRKATDAAYAKGDMPDLLIEYAKKAEELGVDDHLEMARIIDNRGKAWGWAGRGTAAQDLADYDAALKVFEEENSLADVAEALWRSGVVQAFYFEALRDKGLGQLLRSVVIFREVGDVRKETEVHGWTCGVLRTCGFFEESLKELIAANQMAEEFHFTELLGDENYGLSWLDEIDGKLEDAISHSLKALDYFRKLNSIMRPLIYSDLIRQYSKLGDLTHADEYFEKLRSIPSETAAIPHTFLIEELDAKGVYFAAKGQWEESNQRFEKVMQVFSTFNNKSYEVPVFRDLSWALERQGRFEEAKLQRNRASEWLNQVEERFGHANLQLSLMLPRRLQVGKDVEIRLDFVNVGRKPSLLTKIEGITLPELSFSKLPSFCSLQNNSLILNDESVGPFQVETIKLKFAATKVGSYVLNPEVIYLDDLGNTKTFKLNPITLTVEPAKPSFEVLPGRVTTGTAELDKLLYGGIPERYAVALVSASFEERQKLIENYVEAGLKNGQTTFYLTSELGTSKILVEQFLQNMFLFVCNPRADLMVKDLPNIYRLKGVDSLTEIDIALTKASRQLSASMPGSKRACIEIVSDVLLQHHAVTTRKWLSGVIQDLKSKGFTILAVVNPRMHPAEEFEAVLGLFDGEIRMLETEDSRKALRVTKLHGQNYLKGEVTLG
jgi:tetratricopeptide (TPR) repeat protein/KaiC/GvpD/RAD55 family RecA-like ATPase